MLTRQPPTRPVPARLKDCLLCALKVRHASGTGFLVEEYETLYRHAVIGAEHDPGWNDGSPAAELWYNTYPPEGLMGQLLRELWLERKVEFVIGGDRYWIFPYGQIPYHDSKRFICPPSYTVLPPEEVGRYFFWSYKDQAAFLGPDHVG